MPAPTEYDPVLLDELALVFAMAALDRMLAEAEQQSEGQIAQDTNKGDKG